MAFSFLWVVKYQAGGRAMHTVINRWKSTWMSSRLEGNQLRAWKSTRGCSWNDSSKHPLRKREWKGQPLWKTLQLNELSALLTIKLWVSPARFLETNREFTFTCIQSQGISIPGAQLARWPLEKTNKQRHGIGKGSNLLLKRIYIWL